MLIKYPVDDPTDPSTPIQLVGDQIETGPLVGGLVPMFKIMIETDDGDVPVGPTNPLPIHDPDLPIPAALVGMDPSVDAGKVVTVEDDGTLGLDKMSSDEVNASDRLATIGGAVKSAAEWPAAYLTLRGFGVVSGPSNPYDFTVTTEDDYATAELASNYATVSALVAWTTTVDLGDLTFSGGSLVFDVQADGSRVTVTIDTDMADAAALAAAIEDQLTGVTVLANAAGTRIVMTGTLLVTVSSPNTVATDSGFTPFTVVSPMARVTPWRDVEDEDDVATEGVPKFLNSWVNAPVGAPLRWRFELGGALFRIGGFITGGTPTFLDDTSEVCHVGEVAHDGLFPWSPSQQHYPPATSVDTSLYPVLTFDNSAVLIVGAAGGFAVGQATFSVVQVDLCWATQQGEV